MGQDRNFHKKKNTRDKFTAITISDLALSPCHNLKVMLTAITGSKNKDAISSITLWIPD